MMQQFHLLTLTEVGRHLVADAGTTRAGTDRTNLDPLDPLGHHVGVVHGDQGHPHAGHLPQLGGPDACAKIRRQKKRV